MRQLIHSLLLIILLNSCATVAPYEMQYIGDSEIQMSSDTGKGFINYVHSIREGATPAEGTKASGGCGCN